MSTYAISDIHGCFDEFMEVLDQVQFGDGDELYILGDLVDRGEQVGACVEWLVEHEANAEGSNVHFILGNHEEMMHDALSGSWTDFEFHEEFKAQWANARNGGNTTLEQLRSLDPDVLQRFQYIVEHAPNGYAMRVRGRVVMLCHAGIRPAEPDSEPAEWLIQSGGDLLWIGAEWYTGDEQAPFDVISGHTPTFTLSRLNLSGCPGTAVADGRSCYMMHWGCRHDIDCGCVFGGRMGLLRLDDWSEFYVSSKKGLRRSLR